MNDQTNFHSPCRADRGPIDGLAGGTPIVEFEVLGRPIPWCLITAKDGSKIKKTRLIAWQAWVAAHARRAMADRVAYQGRVRLVMIFDLLDRPDGMEPDLSNLVKAAEDALQGPVIGNDRQVTAQENRKVPGSDRDQLIVRVYAEGVV